MLHTAAGAVRGGTQVRVQTVASVRRNNATAHDTLSLVVPTTELVFTNTIQGVEV